MPEALGAVLKSTFSDEACRVMGSGGPAVRAGRGPDCGPCGPRRAQGQETGPRPHCGQPVGSSQLVFLEGMFWKEQVG